MNQQWRIAGTIGSISKRIERWAYVWVGAHRGSAEKKLACATRRFGRLTQFHVSHFNI
jgi:hypothetical protein